MVKRVFFSFISAYRGLPAAVWMLTCITLINRAGTMVLFFFSLYLTRQLGMTIAFAGTALSMYGVGAVIGTFLGGRITDRWGPFAVMLCSLTASGFGYLIVGNLKSHVPILIGMGFLGLVVEGYRPAAGTAMAEICPAHLRTRAYALDRLAINLGATIGPAIGGLLALSDYSWLFVVDGFTCFGAALAFIFLVRYIHRNRLVEGDPEAVHELPDLTPLKDGVFVIFLSLMFVSALVFFQLTSTYPLYLKEFYQISEFQVGLLLSINGILIITCEMVLTHKIENFSPLRVVGLGALLTGLGLGMLPLGDTMRFAAYSVVVWTIGEMLWAPMAMAFVANRAGKRNRGKYMGMFNMAYSAGFIAGPALGTWIYAKWSPAHLWYGTALVSVLLVFGFEALSRGPKPSRPKS